MTRQDARDFLKIAAEIKLAPKVTKFSLDQANEALQAVKDDAIDGAAVLSPKDREISPKMKGFATSLHSNHVEN